MSLWRVRITMPAEPASREWLAAALAGRHVALRPPLDDADPTGELIIELPRDESLGTLLSDLHMISPQVYVSSVSEPPTAATETVAPQAADQGVGEPALVEASRPAAHRDQAAVKAVAGQRPEDVGGLV